jgi:hypothetical protein
VTGLFNQRVSLGQGDGSEVELIVNGTALYATYETLDGFAAIYDDDRERFYYARVVDGRYQSTGVPVTERPPKDLDRHARESDEVRAERVREREAHLARETDAEAIEGHDREAGTGLGSNQEGEVGP